MLGVGSWLGQPAYADFEAGRQAYERGDYETARKELGQDAERGDAAAQFLLGLLYDGGKGGAQDHAEAVRWYRLAAEQGEGRAQFALGIMYYRGDGVSKDLVEAARWSRKAAEQGYFGAQFNLGLMYYRGEGVARDLVNAYMWLTLAAKSKKDAAQMADKVAAEMTPAQRQDAKRLAAEWRPVRSPQSLSTFDDYLAVRKSHATVLARRGPPPGKWQPQPAPEGTREILYPSGEARLKGWLALPPGAGERKVPAVVFFGGGHHGGGLGDFARARAFLEKGYAVLMPMLRAQRGNPGSFELLYGEVEDGRAAVVWLASQPGIDADRIYTFGHSLGGAISALLSLWDEVPIRLGGSSGGIYDADTFHGWRWNGSVPFNPNDATECKLRLLIGNTRFMKRPHIAYLGTEDFALGPIAETAGEESRRTGGQLTVAIVPGNHFTSLDPAIAAFLKDIESNK